ncbi:hypothetical protein ACFXI6_47820 [Streptomyces mirabilis]|uniref:hypothetical protein n=1 Tax=Streptomyces mirabilis TaxID=68239 RepID=UPI0036D0D6DD
MNIAWLSSIPGAALGAAVTYRVARIQWGERRQDAAERREMEEARTRREAWKNDYDSVHAMLIDAANLAYQVNHRGPLTRRDFADLETALLHTNLEQASQRTPDELEAPLLEVAKHVANLLPQAVASDAETLDTYELVRQGEAAAVPAERTIRSEHIRAVAQARAAEDLEAAVRAARRALTKAWGG